MSKHANYPVPMSVTKNVIQNEPESLSKILNDESTGNSLIDSTGTSIGTGSSFGDTIDFSIGTSIGTSIGGVAESVGSDSDSNPDPNSSYAVASVESIASDRWSQRGVSSKVSISISAEAGDVELANRSLSERQGKKNTNCNCIKKLVGNVLLPGLVGIYSFRQVEKLPHKHPISKELMANSLYYCSRIRYFLKNELLPEMKSLASEIYFPTGQIEADGLSCNSAEIWAATYLLLSLHKHIREADFHNIRSAFTSLAWDSAQTYRAALRFHRCVEMFRSKVIPIWNQIEEIEALDLKNQFSVIDRPPRPAGNKKGRKKKNNMGESSTLLSSVRIEEHYLLQHTLSLQIVPERKASMVNETAYQEFSNLGYGKQIEVIKALLGNPIDALHNAPNVFKHIEPKLLTEKLFCPDAAILALNKNNTDCDPACEPDMTCTRALRILSATLNLLFEEVNLPSTLHSDIVESVTCLGEEINDFFGYAEWVANKFSEFHSMLRLCYNFALMCFDLDLPSFESVIKQESVAEEAFALGKGSSSGMLITKNSHGSNLEEDQLEHKVLSLTKLIMEASASFISAEKQVDNDFDWQDFYKTQYHEVLMRLPLRVGAHLLQFNQKNDVQLIIRQKVENAAPHDKKEALRGLPGSLSNLKKINA